MAVKRTGEVFGAVQGMLKKRRHQRTIAGSPQQQMPQTPTTPQVPLLDSQFDDSEGLTQQAPSSTTALSTQPKQGPQGINQVQGRLKKKRSSMGLAQSAMQNPPSAV